VRVFNLTDVPTATLQERGLVNTSISIGGKVVPPGGQADVSRLTGADKFISCGAIAVGEVPAAYLAAKQTQETVVPPPTDPPPPEEPANPTERKKRKVPRE
jgi:hypothetical protein